jgi:nicotinamidase/pyrazinamidase
MQPKMQRGDALIIVAVQRDFCAGGALPVPDGDEVVTVLNQWIEAAEGVGALIYASRDWRPRTHVSFTERGGPWPAHCIQDTPGAQFHPDLRLPPSAIVVSKGVRFDKDQNSAFDDTGLAVELHQRGVDRIWVGGLAQDVCVRATVLDAVREGFEVHVIAAATKPVRQEDGQRALDEIRRAGAMIAQADSVARPQ